MALAVLRCLVFTCVVFMLLELVLVITKRESIPSRLLVLVDTSESMGLNDPYRDDGTLEQLASKLGFEGAAALRKKSRLTLAKAALSRVFDPLATDREISLYGFSHQAVSLGRDELAAAEAKGTETAIGDAITSALAEHRGQPLAGILLVSDGQSNAGEDPRKAAEAAGKQSLPIVSLAVGTEEGPSNARLAAIEADPIVFVRDSTEVSVLVEGHAMQGRTGIVTLEKRQDAGWSEVGREEVTLNEDAASKRVTFKLTPDVVGEIELRARIADFGDELTEADNVASHNMKVVRQQIRVLLVAGAPSPEVQFLRNALLRDTGLEFACWLQTAGDGYEQMGTRPIRRLPVNRQELDQYDVVILFDPDMRALGPAWPELLSQFVGTSGGGLIYVGGEMHTRNLFDGVASDGDDSTGPTIDNSWLRTLARRGRSRAVPIQCRGRLERREPFNLELTAEGEHRSDLSIRRRPIAQSRNPGQPAGHVLALSGDAGQARRDGARSARRSAHAKFVRTPCAAGDAPLRTRTDGISGVR